MRSAAFQSVVCDRDAELLDSPLPRSLVVSDGKLRCLSAIAVPTYFRKWFILSYASLLYKELLLFGPPRARKLAAPSLGFAVPLRDISHPRPSCERSTAPNLAVLDVSHVLDGFLRVWPWRFVSPSSHVQGSLFRGFYLVRSRSSFDDSCPLVVVPTLLMCSCPPISTPSVLALRAFIRVRVRNSMTGV